MPPADSADTAKPRKRAGSLSERKAADGIRVELLSLLGLDRVYDLDRLDLSVRSTIDWNVQRDVTRLSGSLMIRLQFEAGLYGRWLLGTGDPEAVIYSPHPLRMHTSRERAAFSPTISINRSTSTRVRSGSARRPSCAPRFVHGDRRDLHKMLTHVPGQLNSVFVAQAGPSDPVGGRLSFDGEER
jgi:hypothetical protein